MTNHLNHPKTGILTQHLENEEDWQLYQDVRKKDAPETTQLTVYLCGAAIFYGLLHLFFPAHWPLEAIIITIVGLVTANSPYPRVRTLGWVVVAFSVVLAFSLAL